MNDAHETVIVNFVVQRSTLRRILRRFLQQNHYNDQRSKTVKLRRKTQKAPCFSNRNRQEEYDTNQRRGHDHSSPANSPDYVWFRKLTAYRKIVKVEIS